METLISILVGIGLSAACGFRVFVPLLIMSAASLGGFLELNSTFDWIGSYPALAAFAVATLLEITAYFVPGADHLLDVIATPAAVVAGIVATASVVTGMSPLLTWSMAIIAGGGAAAAVQGGTVLTRGASGVTTAGLANPLVSAGELAASIAMPILAILVPAFVALVLAALLLFLLWRRSRKRRTALDGSSA